MVRIHETNFQNTNASTFLHIRFTWSSVECRPSKVLFHWWCSNWYH